MRSEFKKVLMERLSGEEASFFDKYEEKLLTADEKEMQVLLKELAVISMYLREILCDEII